MMNRLLIAAVVLVLVLAMAAVGMACSSFVVYGANGAVFGMNFDIPAFDEAAESRFGFFEESRNRVALIARGDIKVFHYDQNLFFTERGVFGCIHAAYPDLAMNRCEKRLVSWYDLYYWGTQFEKATDEVEFLENARLRHRRDADFHCLFADGQGNALIVEPGVDVNEFHPMKGDYLVMTNFFLHILEGEFAAALAEAHPDVDLLAELDYDGRYRTAEAMIQASLDDFDYLRAFEVLEAVKQRITKVSVVVVPHELKVYFALFQDFSRIWEVDLQAETIATHSGFAEQRVEKIDAKGWTAFELVEWK
jgi:hypothetical protein